MILSKAEHTLRHDIIIGRMVTESCIYSVSNTHEYINPSTLKHSFNNGESWHTEDDIKEALDGKSKSCIECKHLVNGYCTIKQRKLTSDINSISKSGWLHDISCSKHEPK